MSDELGELRRLLNWRLLAGSHEFPGPDGGTCVNEAAVVAAGLPYRRVTDVSDLPDCFSRPLARLALWLNDHVEDDELRTALLVPLVPLLAGSRDSDEVEWLRLDHVEFVALTELLSRAILRCGAPFTALSTALALAPTLDAARAVVGGTLGRSLTLPVKLLLDPAVRLVTTRGPLDRAKLLHDVVRYCTSWRVAAPEERERDLRRYVAALVEALRLGRHDPIPVTLAAARLTQAREETLA